MDLVAYDNEDFSPEIIWKEDDGSLVPLAGYTFLMEVRADPADATAKLSMSTANGKITNEAAGSIFPFADRTEIEAAGAGVYHYDMLAIKDGGEQRIVGGKLHVKRGVSRPV